MASAALSRPQFSVSPVTGSYSPTEALGSVLCDQLLAHMLECDLCLDPEQPACTVCMNLQGDIQAQGGPGKGVVFAF
jgi:hypothetical protein